jgi:hypothetical protein
MADSPGHDVGSEEYERDGHDAAGGCSAWRESTRVPVNRHGERPSQPVRLSNPDLDKLALLIGGLEGRGSPT